MLLWILHDILAETHLHLDETRLVIEVMRVIQQVLAAISVGALGRACLVQLMELAAETQIILLFVVELDTPHLGHLANTLELCLNFFFFP